MDLNKLTIKARAAVNQGQQIATQNGQQAIETGHLLQGILREDDNVAPFFFQKMGVAQERVEQILSSILSAYPKVAGGDVYLSPDGQKAIQNAFAHAKDMGDEYVSIESLMYAILTGKDDVARMLKDCGMTKDGFNTAIKELRKGSTVNSHSAEDTYNSLNKYAVHLNEQARKGKLDPVIGRDEEIRRVLQILSRRTKNNPILIGEVFTKGA